MNMFDKIFDNENDPSSKSEDLDEGLMGITEILEKHKRKAWLPIVQEYDHEFSDKSKFGGFPYLRNEEDWPKCPNCKKNMQLFLQLNLKQLPEKEGEGLIQVFYCTTTEPNCETQLKAYLPFSKAVVCRKIKVDGDSAHIQPVIDHIFDEKLITGWEQRDDYPHPEEYEQLGIEIDDDTLEIMETKGVGLTLQKDKLGGWPFWVQSVEYPSDRETNSQMELLFQLDSEDNLPFMFGDSGIGHLTQSPDNDEELAFGWACY